MKNKCEGCQAQDAFELTSRTITPEGYLQAPATIARTGVQLYRAREFPPLVQQGVDPNLLLRIHRPAEEVFDPTAMSSFEDKPVILEPHQTTTADNWKELAVGDVRGIQRSGDLLQADKLTVRDKDAVAAVQGGKKYLSCGYKFDLDLTPGTTADGQQYDAIMRNIRGNHVAITDTPRGGQACKIADSAKGAKKLMKITIDGVVFEAEDSLGSAVTKLIGERDAARNQQPSVTLKVGDTSKTVTGSDAIIAELTAKDAKIAELQSKIPTQEALDKMVEERVTVRSALVGDVAKLDPEYKPEGKTNDVVAREVLTKVLAGDTAAKGVVEAVLGSKTLEAADSATLTVALKAAVAAGTKVTATGSDAAVADALTKKNNSAAGEGNKVVGREAFIARQNAAWQGK